MTTKRKNPFKLPKGYFSFLDKEIFKKTKASFKGYGFHTPKSYLKDLEDDIIKKTIGKNVFYDERNFKYLLSSLVIAASIFIYYNLSSTSDTLVIKENNVTFDDYIENYYIDDLTSYEIISMLDEAEIDKTLNYGQIP